MRILLVDDDPEIRLITAHVLRAAGHEVEDAADADAAVAMYTRHPWDAVLLDLYLGDEDGVDVARRLAALDGPAAPVIFLTATPRADQTARMEAAGARGIIRKPFDPITLDAEISRILQTPL